MSFERPIRFFSLIDSLEFPSPLALYIHIPFCDLLCPYCDFAKSSDTRSDVVSGYFALLHTQLEKLIQKCPQIQFSSVFFGGGTPGLFDIEYSQLFDLIAPRLLDSAEVSLECNPKNISRSRLEIWRDLGINRVSVGVQSFQTSFLRSLGRNHDSADALNGLELLSQFFDNWSFDLIYGLPHQTAQDWQKDLDQALSLAPPHISAYCLTYEQKTPMGRQYKRGLLPPQSEEDVSDFYHQTRESFSSYEHYEISNWCVAGKHSRHNQAYWQGQSYLGLGVGAHSYIYIGSTTNNKLDYGQRFHFGSNLGFFLKQNEEVMVSYEEGRTAEDYLLERVATSARTQRGVPVDLLASQTKQSFSLTPALQDAINKQHLVLGNGYLHLPPQEWLIENHWILEILKGFSF